MTVKNRDGEEKRRDGGGDCCIILCIYWPYVHCTVMFAVLSSLAVRQSQ